jgi:putative phage-type endonuclease
MNTAPHPPPSPPGGDDEGREQLLSREGLGGSEMAAALGVDPFKSPVELWEEKIEAGEREVDEARSDAMEWGSAVEAPLRRWYARKAGVPIWHPPRSLFHQEILWLRSTPDGIVLRAGEREPPSLERDPPKDAWREGVECKLANFRQAHLWGAPGTDDIPLSYILQCQTGMAVTGLPRWQVVATIGGQPPTVYGVERDDELIETMILGATAFMQSVWDKVPPPVDGSEAYARFIGRRYPWAIDRPVVADADQEQKAARLRQVREQEYALAEVRAKLENEIRLAIGEHSGMQTTQGLISWRQSKAASVVDYKLAFGTLADRLGMDAKARAAFEEQHRVERKAARPFVCPRAWVTGGTR